jgi:hypothetical protein
MTRKLLSAVAMMAAVLFTGSIAAEAADVTFGGQFRPRFEWWNEGSAGGTSIVDHNDAKFIDMRVRLNTNIKIDENTSGFIQFQSVQRWGTITAGSSGGGTPSNVQNVSNPNNDVGLHQAYFTLNKLFGAPLALKAGRQEVILDGHRLFGHTGWTTGAQTHDALKFSHSHDNMTLAYVYSKVVENSIKALGGAFAGASNDDVDDTEAHILWANMKGLAGENSSTSAYLVLMDSDCNSGFGTNANCAGNLGSQDFYTIGARQSGGMGNLIYRGELYYQTGKSGLVATNSAGTPTGGAGDVESFLLGLRAGYKMPNQSMKPSVTLWWDYLSGTNGSDQAAGDSGSFNTLFDTGHKFYGFMDFYLGTQFRGLSDLAIKFKAQPAAKTTLKLDIHNFSQTSSNGATCATCSPGAKTLGQEVDFTAIYKYSPSTKWVVGYSHYFTRDAFNGVSDNDDQDWMYVMIDVKF